MDEGQGVRYWCHACEELIDPMPEMKCPGCDGGFVEELDSEGFEPAANARSDRSLSHLAPLLLGMLGGSSRRSRLRRAVLDEDDDDDTDDDSDRELDEFIRRRRRRGSSALARLLQTLRDDIRGLDDSDSDTERDRERERWQQRERERLHERERQRDRGRERTESLILVNSNNEAIILQGTFGPDENQEESGNTSSGVSLGDYFLGPGLDILLQRMAESDLNRSGTPPAKKEAVAALPTVTIQEALGCSVCLEDFEMGSDAKEMPCQHKFHSHCILPWLELHSSCPICRFLLPTEETKNPCDSANRAEAVRSDGDNAAASSSDHGSSTSRNGDNHSGRHIFSTLSALFSEPSPSSSEENAPHSSEG